MKKYLIFLFLSSILMAKDINVGDLVTLKFEGAKKEEILNAFENSKLELENVKEVKDGYIVSFRGYTVGENKLNIGNKELTLDIKSTLSSEDKELYPHLSDKSDLLPYSENFPYQILIAGVTAIFSLIYLFKGIHYKKRLKSLNPEERFEDSLKNISDENWEFQISLALREYIDSKYASHFMNGIYTKVGKIDQKDIKFIEKLDRYKFSKEEKGVQREVLEKVTSIYEKVRGEKKDV